MRRNSVGAHGQLAAHVLDGAARDAGLAGARGAPPAPARGAHRAAAAAGRAVRAARARRARHARAARAGQGYSKYIVQNYQLATENVFYSIFLSILK